MGLVSWLKGSRALHRAEHAAFGVAAEMPASFVLMGDSLARQNNQSNGSATLVRSGGTVTLTKTTHAVWPGQVIWVENVNGSGGTSFQGRFTVLTRPDANTLTYADSRADDTVTSTEWTAGVSGRSAGWYIESWLGSGAWFGWLNGLFGGGLNLVANMGWGGSKVSDILTTLLPDILALSAGKRVIDLGGINDVMADRSAAAIYADKASIYSALLNIGAQVEVISILPMHSSHASFSQARNVVICEVNRRLRRLCMQTPGLHFHDGYSQMVDVTATGANKGSAKANYTSDYVHLSALGARMLARVLYANMTGAAASTTTMNRNPSIYGHPVGDPKSCSAADTYGNNSASLNVNDYGPWDNTTGGAWGGSGGTHTNLSIPAGLRMDGTANITVSNTNAPAAAAPSLRSDGLGYDLDFYVSASGSGTLTIEARVTTGARAGVGDKVRGYAELKLSGVSASNINGVYVEGKTYDGSVNSFGYFLAAATSAALFGTDDWCIALPCPEIPHVGTGGYTIFSLRIVFAAAGTVTGKFGRCSIIKNETP